MPVSIYAISHKDTGSILSYCVLGDQKVTDVASATALRDRLVGDKLVISLRTAASGGFSFLKSDVTVDEITIDESSQSDFYRDPFAYVLVLPSSSQPGDGKIKTIGPGGPLSKFQLNAAGTLTVTLPTGLGPPTKLLAVLEGHAPSPITLSAPSSTVDIPLGVSSLTAGHSYAVVFLGQGLPSSVVLLPAV